MAIYNFLDMPPQNGENQSFVTWEGGFTEEELDRIEAYCDKLDTTTATLAHNGKTAGVRESKVGWITLDAETEWFYDRMAYIARQLNAQFYRFDLTGFVEDMQFTVYESDHKSFYEWHVDAGDDTNTPRKLSMVLPLTDPKKYKGGKLQVKTTKDDTEPDATRGTVIAFPSYRLHRVTPVTHGLRKSIVVWVGGPPFK